MKPRLLPSSVPDQALNTSDLHQLLPHSKTHASMHGRPQNAQLSASSPNVLNGTRRAFHPVKDKHTSPQTASHQLTAQAALRELVSPGKGRADLHLITY